MSFYNSVRQMASEARKEGFGGLTYQECAALYNLLCLSSDRNERSKEQASALMRALRLNSRKSDEELDGFFLRACAKGKGAPLDYSERKAFNLSVRPLHD